MSDPSRRYERLDIELPCRLFIPGPGKGSLTFQAFCTSRNLGLGGLFVASSFLLREGLEVMVELALPEGPLAIRSRIAHVVGHGDEALETGMGIEFLDVDAHGRETLLRYFAPERYHAFFGAFTGEFPHLEKVLPLQDVALVLNLWEEWKIKREGGPASTASGAPAAPRRAPGLQARPPRPPPPAVRPSAGRSRR